MKAAIITFRGCMDGCPHAEGADRIMSPVFCTLANRKVIGYSSKSSEIPEGDVHPPWCPMPDADPDARYAVVRTCIECQHYVGCGDCGYPKTRSMRLERKDLRALDIHAAHRGIAEGCPLPRAGR